MNNNDYAYRDINDHIFESEINREDDKTVLLLVWSEGRDSRVMNRVLLAYAKDHPEIVYRRIVGRESKKILKYVGGTLPMTLIFQKGEFRQVIAGESELEYIEKRLKQLSE